jgi:catechol 2,3-dioxygenase-like lactoylglutathione lyase family enzyme
LPGRFCLKPDSDIIRRMRTVMGGFALFAAGIGVGVFLMSPAAAQQSRNPGLRLNHVGIYAKDFDESMRFYTQTMGLREAFSIKDEDGKPTLTYLQINKDTFLELAPATAARPAGLSHVGIWPENLSATVAVLRQRGVKVDDPRTGATKTSITNVTDPNGVRLELLDFLPDSLPRKAMDTWK